MAVAPGSFHRWLHSVIRLKRDILIGKIPEEAFNFSLDGTKTLNKY
jgi:hypothetical protein